MGSWSVSCGISNIAITSGNECVIIPIKGDSSEYGGYLPSTLPIFGTYNDYGGMEDIVHDDNTKLIEDHLGITIDEFVEFLVDGKFTYDRDEAIATKAKLEANDRLEEVANWRFMWVDKQVYEVMIQNLNVHDQGYMDYGTPEMAKLLGLEVVEGFESKNYDPKRFKTAYKKGDTILYSDGSTLLSENGQYVYHMGKGNESSIETYIDVPEELQYLKGKTKSEAWRLMSERKQMSTLGYIFGDRFGSMERELDLKAMMLELATDGDVKNEESVKKILAKAEKSATIVNKYFKNLDAYGDRIVDLINIRGNMHPMSGRFYPHVLYLTPQCGEHAHHQKLLEAFAEINKSYVDEYEEDED